MYSSEKVKFKFKEGDLCYTTQIEAFYSFPKIHQNDPYNRLPIYTQVKILRRQFHLEPEVGYRFEDSHLLYYPVYSVGISDETMELVGHTFRGHVIAEKNLILNKP
jgi:hypothetical protein